MRKNNAKIISIIGLVVSGIALMTNPLLLMAQGNDSSSAELRIFSGIISVTAPNNFAFSTIFLPPTSDPSFNIYKTLLPLTPGQVIRADDADDGTFNFKVTMSMSNFNNTVSGGIIPFTNFAALTLANNTVDGIDAEPGSLPLPAANITAPWSCAWNGQTGTLGTNCDADFNTAAFTGNGPLLVTDPTIAINDTDTLITVTDSRNYEGQIYGTDPQAPINDTNTSIPVTNFCNYEINDVLHFNSGEYAIVTNVPIPTLVNPCGPQSIEVSRAARGSIAASQGAGSGIVIERKNNIILFNSGDEYAVVTNVSATPPFNQIEVIRGVSGTTALPQTLGSGILNIGTESSEIDIMVALEPGGGRIGAYTVGLGIRALLEPRYLESGDYSGQLTFSLYQCADLSCI